MRVSTRPILATSCTDTWRTSLHISLGVLRATVGLMQCYSNHLLQQSCQSERPVQHASGGRYFDATQFRLHVKDPST